MAARGRGQFWTEAVVPGHKGVQAEHPNVATEFCDSELSDVFRAGTGAVWGNWALKGGGGARYSWRRLWSSSKFKAGESSANWKEPDACRGAGSSRRRGPGAAVGRAGQDRGEA